MVQARRECIIPSTYLLAGVVFIATALLPLHVVQALMPAQQQQIAPDSYCEGVLPGDQLLPGFAAPYSYFGGGQLMKVWCALDGATAAIGNRDKGVYVYRKGYIFESGQWKSIELSGYPMAGADWYVGEGYYNIPYQTGVQSGGYMLAFTCERSNKAWKCGCADAACSKPTWQLQSYGEPYKARHPRESQPIFASKLSAVTATPGTPLSLSGYNFGSAGNVVYFNDKKVAENVASPTGVSLGFTVPVSIVPGKYVVTVGHGTRRSKDMVSVWVTTLGAKAPIIERVTPQIIRPGDTVTLTGTGFTPKGNEVITSFKVLPGQVSPDGKTLRFVYEGLGLGHKFQDLNGKEVDFEITTAFTVANTNGHSNTVLNKLLQ